MAYTRSTTVDSSPSGDTTKQAVLDVDADLTAIFADLNTHEALTTNAHGFTGTKTGSGAMVAATSPTIVTPTITGGSSINQTITTPTVTGTVTASSATITGATLANPAIQVGSDADGDMYLRLSSKLARVAKGPANSLLFMKPDATIAEWGTLTEWGSLTYDVSTTGTTNVTGHTFKPRTGIFLATIDGGYSMSVGISIEDSGKCIYASGAGTWTLGATYPWAFHTAGGVAVLSAIAMNADGFSYNKFILSGSPTGTGSIYYTLFR